MTGLDGLVGWVDLPGDRTLEDVEATTMDARQAYALLNPLTDTERETIVPYRRIVPQPDGNLLVTVLAVDR